MTDLPLPAKITRRRPHISMEVASGEAKAGPDDLPEGACFIGKSLSADLATSTSRRFYRTVKRRRRLSFGAADQGV